MNKKVVEKLEYLGFGFTVILLNVPVKSLRGIVVPDIDYNALQLVVLHHLGFKPFPLTGNEIRFIRQSLHMTLTKFATHFGVTHPAVIKWEKTQNKPAKISLATELYIRLHILDYLKVPNQKFRACFLQFDSNPNMKTTDFAVVVALPMEIDSDLVKAKA